MGSVGARLKTPTQGKNLSRVLQERDDNQQEKNQEGSFVAKVTRSHSKSYNKSSDISEEKMPR